MKKTIRIFVAGSKVLKAERNALKAVAQDLNTRYSENAIDVSIVMKSYEHFKDKQKEYNAYISEYADLVIFVLDGEIGDFTREEFYKAVEAYKNKQIPEILVFLKSFKKKTEQIKDIENLMRDSMGEHFFYINYDDNEDLQSKVEKRINRFVVPTEHSRETKRWRSATFLVAAAALLMIGGILFMFFKGGKTVDVKDSGVKQGDPMLLFMGGGSVFKYIEEKAGVRIDEIKGYPNSIYMPIATGNLWGIIAEEYHRRGVKQNIFSPIFIAANKIDIAAVNKKVPDSTKVRDNMLVIELFLGNDITTIYFDKDNVGFSKEIDTMRCLYPDDVRTIIENALANNTLYTTSRGSGTFSSFMTVLDNDTTFVEKIFSGGRKEFHEKYPLNLKDNYVVLGSVFYHPDFGDDSSTATDRMHKYYVIDDNDHFYLKDMCLYFCAYKEGNKYIIPNAIRKFIKDNLKPVFNEEYGSLWNTISHEDGFKQEDVNLSDEYMVRLVVEGFSK